MGQFWIYRPFGPAVEARKSEPIGFEESIVMRGVETGVLANFRSPIFLATNPFVRFHSAEAPVVQIGIIEANRLIHSVEEVAYPEQVDHLGPL